VINQTKTEGTRFLSKQSVFQSISTVVEKSNKTRRPSLQCTEIRSSLSETRALCVRRARRIRIWRRVDENSAGGKRANGPERDDGIFEKVF